jgi:calpain-7
LKPAKQQLRYVTLWWTKPLLIVVLLTCAYTHPQKYSSQLQSATSKDEALTLAISAAENLMSALKLCSDPNEKKQLKAQCSDMMTTAGRIKNDASWKPAVKAQGRTSQKLDINQWAAEVISSLSTTTGFEDSASQSSISHHGLSSTTGPVANASALSGRPSISSLPSPGRSRVEQQELRACVKAARSPVMLIDLSDDYSSSPPELKLSTPTDTRREDRLQVKYSSAAGMPILPVAAIGTSPVPASSAPPLRTKVTDEGVAAASPSIASYSHIHRLVEPVSTRKRPKREDIILLKASMVNGFKCPPWDKTPSPSDFMVQQDTELFM